MSILNSILKSLGESQLEKLGTKLWLSPAQTKQATDLLLPLLLGAINKNTQTKEWATSLYDTLDRHINPIEDVEDIDENDWFKILWHLFGNKLEKIEEKASKEIGLETNQVNSLLKNLAPILLGKLGEQKSSKWAGLEDLIGMIGWATNQAKEENGTLGNLLGAFLDKDGDGDYKDDLLQKGADMLMDQFRNKW